MLEYKRVQLLRRVRSAAVAVCLENGVTNYRVMRGIIATASATLRPPMVAGVKAAITKGQNV